MHLHVLNRGERLCGTEPCGRRSYKSKTFRIEWSECVQSGGGGGGRDANDHRSRLQGNLFTYVMNF